MVVHVAEAGHLPDRKKAETISGGLNEQKELPTTALPARSTVHPSFPSCSWSKKRPSQWLNRRIKKSDLGIILQKLQTRKNTYNFREKKYHQKHEIHVKTKTKRRNTRLWRKCKWNKIGQDQNSLLYGNTVKQSREEPQFSPVRKSHQETETNYLENAHGRI